MYALESPRIAPAAAKPTARHDYPTRGCALPPPRAARILRARLALSRINSCRF
jgi:hypothetical protein